MDYERIHRVQQMGVISPTKLRMKLLGVHNSRKKNEGGSKSSRNSPSKLEEMEYAKNHLLTSDFDEEVSLSFSKPLGGSVDPNSEVQSKNRNNMRNVAYQVQSCNGLSTVHPERPPIEEDGNVYDSGHENGSTCNFEFHRGERLLHHHYNQASGPFFRHIPSKWNDAEKWIVNRQPLNHTNAMRSKNLVQGQGVSHQVSSANWGRTRQEMGVTDTKRIDSTVDPISQNVVAKFSFVPPSLQPNLVFTSGVSGPTNLCQDDCEASNAGKPATPVVPAVESVSMRDVGTEMTPIPSQEPSRTGTPMGATTPSRSPRSSNPSAPKREHVSLPSSTAKVHEGDCKEKSSKELSEKELKLETRKEIADLGMKLGKMNIASWASKEAELASSSPKKFDRDQNVKAENEARAAAWEEAEKAKHMARYRREEIKIQAWENHQQAKFEAKMRNLEVHVEELRARTQEKIARKLVETTRQVEERRADAEARKNQKVAQSAKKAELIRQTGRLPPSNIRCCSWFM